MKMFKKEYCAHKFEPRYDLKNPEVSDFSGKCSMTQLIEYNQSLKEKMYVQDICVKCGMRIKR